MRNLFREMGCQHHGNRYAVGKMAEKLLRDKLGYKPGQAILLLDLPDGLPDPFDGIPHDVASVTKAKLGKRKFDLVVAFTQDQAALTIATKVVVGCMVDDPKLWLVYPKKSGKLTTDLNRDAGWKPMFDAGYLVVSIASVDETWSAVRFRPKHLVKSVRF